MTMLSPVQFSALQVSEVPIGHPLERIKGDSGFNNYLRSLLPSTNGQKPTVWFTVRTGHTSKGFRTFVIQGWQPMWVVPFVNKLLVNTLNAKNKTSNFDRQLATALSEKGLTVEQIA